MNHYKTPEGDIRAIDVGQEHLIEDDWVIIAPDDLQGEIDKKIPEPSQEVKDQLRKLEGVDFEGTMCSATESDQNGLLCMYPFIKAKQMSPNFKFENGSRLRLTDENIDGLLAVWGPFRNSFFE